MLAPEVWVGAAAAAVMPEAEPVAVAAVVAVTCRLAVSRWVRRARRAFNATRRHPSNRGRQLVGEKSLRVDAGGDFLRAGVGDDGKIRLTECGAGACERESNCMVRPPELVSEF